MNDQEIQKLRETIAAKTPVMWWMRGSHAAVVSGISPKPVDPDGTGIPDVVAFLEGSGHLDLSNVDAADFHTIQPLFG